MYDVYQHGTMPEYRFIKRSTDPMPSQARSDWKLVRTAPRVSPEAEKEIETLGYHLYKIGVQFQEITGAQPPVKK